MTDHDLALVLPSDTQVELLVEGGEAARGYARSSVLFLDHLLHSRR